MGIHTSRNFPADRLALEATALALAERCGLETAASQVVEVEGKDVLLIERFDVSATTKGLARRHFFSALTALDLDEMEARYAGYPLLADYLRRYGDDPGAQCRALFDRYAATNTSKVSMPTPQ